MLKFTKLQTKNPYLKIIYGIVNFLIGFCFGFINLFIGIGKGTYHLLTKKYRYESLYITIVSILVIIFAIMGINQGNDATLGNFSNSPVIPLFIHILILIISLITLIFSFTMYILTIFKGKKISEKWFWYIRGVSYFVTLLLVFFLVDYVILDFIYRYQIVTRPTENTSSYDVIIFFMKDYKNSFWDGIKTTISLALLGTIIGLVLALGLVCLRMLKIDPRDNDFVKFLKKIGSGFANIYVTVIRGTPMIVQAFIFYYLVLMIVRQSVSSEDYRYFIDSVWTPFRAGLFTVSINTTAYLTEVLRGGINAVDKGQTEACQALGLSKFKTMLLVVFPQSIKNSFPSIGNEFIVNIKDTSVLTLIGVLDLFSVSKNDILGKYSAKNLEAYLIVAIYYLILTYLTSKLLQYFEKRMNMPVKGITSSN